MQAFCSGQILSGVIKAIILAGISLLTGYLIIGLGSPVYLILIGTFAIALVALSGGLTDLGVSVLLGIFANWILFGYELIPQKLETLVLSNFESAFENPPTSLGILIPCWVFLFFLLIASIILTFIKPGPDIGKPIFFISLVVGIIVGVIFLFVFQEQSGSQLLKALAIYGGIIGFIGGLIPGPPI